MSVLKKNSRVIFSYPFSGSLYAFFTEQDRGKLSAEHIKHPYYNTLYGKKYNAVRDLALTQLLVYDEVYLAPEDNIMPDYHKYSTNGKYQNKELGLFSDWNDYNDNYKEIMELIIRDEKDQVISYILRNVPKHAKRQILNDCRLEIALAKKYKCPILSYGGRSAIISRLSELDNKNTIVESVHKIKAIEEYLDIYSLTFNPTNYDNLYTYKRDKYVRKYASNFRKIINKIDSNGDVRLELLKLINEAINTRDLIEKTSGVMDFSSKVTSFMGFIPMAGPVFSCASLALTFGSENLNKVSKHSWIELGDRIKKIKCEREINNLILNELKSDR